MLDPDLLLVGETVTSWDAVTRRVIGGARLLWTSVLHVQPSSFLSTKTLKERSHSRGRPNINEAQPAVSSACTTVACTVTPSGLHSYVIQ